MLSKFQIRKKIKFHALEIMIYSSLHKKFVARSAFIEKTSTTSN